MIKYLEKEEDFNLLINEGIVVDFYADWCGPCKMIGEVLEELPELNILKVNVDSFRNIAVKYGVMSIPTLIKFDKGEIVKTLIGYKDKEEIKKELL